jgi:cell division protease FtsH
MNAKLRDFALWTMIVLLLLALFTLFQNPSQRTAGAPSISFSQLLNDVDQGRVRDVRIQGDRIEGTYTDGRRFETYAPNDPTLMERLRSKGVSITAVPVTEDLSWVVSLLTSWLPFIALIGVWFFLSRHMRAGLQAQGPGQSQASRGEIEGLKRRIEDMQKQIDELSRKVKG